MKLPDRLAASSEAARLSEEREKLDRDAVRDWAAKWVVEHLKADGWIRDFPGEDYLFDALAQLQRKPDSWWPLHILRWTSGIDPADAGLAQRLRDGKKALSLTVLG